MNTATKSSIKAIVLSGGGARGAYQVGVLKALSEIACRENKPVDIKIYTGLSAGGINAGFMAAYADDFHAGVASLVRLWSTLESRQVFSSDAFGMAKIALRWMEELPFGAIIGTTPGRALLDTTPLKELIDQNLPFEKIQKNIDRGHLYAVAVSATDYGNSDSVTFVQSRASTPTWKKTKKISVNTPLTTSHIMASSAIPVLFPPVKVGERHFGDGCLRNTSPCAPAIHLGAERLLVIGVRLKGSTAYDNRHEGATDAPSFARVLNVLLNAVLLDGIETDIERLERMNRFVAQVPEQFQRDLNYRVVPSHFVFPTYDIGELALQHARNLPRLIRYLFKGLGRLEDASELISYLLFDPVFCEKLIEIGYRDGLAQSDKLLAFLD